MFNSSGEDTANQALRMFVGQVRTLGAVPQPDAPFWRARSRPNSAGWGSAIMSEPSDTVVPDCDKKLASALTGAGSQRLRENVRSRHFQLSS
jgi:hypothetical protein